MSTTTDRHFADPETAARWERVAHVVACASVRTPEQGLIGRFTLRRSEALLVAHDLFMLGEIAAEPSLRWTAADTEAALSPWNVRVVPDEDR